MGCFHYLDNRNASYEIIEISEKGHTVEDVERICQCTKPEIIKTLLFIGQKPIVVLMTGEKMVDLGKLKQIMNDDSLKMASRKDVRTYTGYAIGSVSPFGLPNDIKIIADTAIETLKSMVIGSGQSDKLIRMKATEFLNIINASFFSLS